MNQKHITDVLYVSEWTDCFSRAIFFLFIKDIELYIFFINLSIEFNMLEYAICVITIYEIGRPKWANTSWKFTGIAVGYILYNCLQEIVWNFSM
jgi:hypothetical protein